jgi:hypothetical protein
MLIDLIYAIYLFVSITLTVWVARTLSKSGEVFLIKCFGQDESLAKSTNHLLVVGFYLVNIGFIALRLDGWDGASGGVVPYLGGKIGITALILGAMLSMVTQPDGFRRRFDHVARWAMG